MKQQIQAVDLLIVRRKSLIPEHADYHKWESMLTPGHWINTSWKYIMAALEEGYHILWNPENKFRLKRAS